MTPETIGLIAGVLFLLIAVIGGGFKLKELEIPSVPMRARIGSGILGIVFVALSGYFVLTSGPEEREEPDPTVVHQCRRPRELPSMAEGNRSEAEAKADLELRGFRNVTVESDFSSGAPTGIVVGQEPAPRAILCPSDPVTITVAR